VYDDIYIFVLMKLIVVWNVMRVRLFHVDDIPSGMGGDALDFNKASAVSCILAVRIACCVVLYYCLNKMSLKFTTKNYVHLYV